MTEASASSLLAAFESNLAMRRLRALMAEPKAIIGGGFILALTVIALFAPWIAPKNPLEQDLMLASLPPAGLASAEPG
jgi:ABC-type dipeptide/oligopeptide/nickel transport system permease subunit